MIFLLKKMYNRQCFGNFWKENLKFYKTDSTIRCRIDDADELQR